MKVFISYGATADQVTALRLQALGAVNGLTAYVPPGLLGVNSLEILHYPELRSGRIVRVDLDKVGPKGRSAQRRERWVRHDDHVFAKSNAGVVQRRLFWPWVRLRWACSF